MPGWGPLKAGARGGRPSRPPPGPGLSALRGEDDQLVRARCMGLHCLLLFGRGPAHTEKHGRSGSSAGPQPALEALARDPLPLSQRRILPKFRRCRHARSATGRGGFSLRSVQGIRLEVDRRNVAHWRAGTWKRAVGAAALALPAHATSQSSHPVLISAGPIDSRNAVH